MTNNELGDQINDNIRDRRQRQLADLRYRLKRSESRLTLAQIDFDEAEEKRETAFGHLQQSQREFEDMSDLIGLLERETE